MLQLADIRVNYWLSGFTIDCVECYSLQIVCLVCCQILLWTVWYVTVYLHNV